MDQFIKTEIKPESLYANWDHSKLFHCDAQKFLKSLPNEIADIVFLDPPFNLGKKYGNSSKSQDSISNNAYASFLKEIIELSIAKLRPGGALYLYHMPEWALQLGATIQKKLNFRHWIAISMKNGFVRGDNLYPAHYALLYFTKGEPKNFNRPKIPADTCRHCGKYVKDYGGYKKYIEDGINLSDIWTDLSPVRHKSTKNRPANELPIQMLNRIVHISGVEDGLLIDPFVGSGTSALAAKNHKMNFLVCDKEKLCCKITKQRINN